MMTERDLAFYLKGYFEIKNEDDKVYRSHLVKIKARIEAVLESGPSSFASSISAVLEHPLSVSKLVDAYFETEINKTTNRNFVLTEKVQKAWQDVNVFTRDLLG